MIACSHTRTSSKGLVIRRESSRMLTATAWLPLQPLMSETIGRNTASAITAASVCSYAAITLAAGSSRNSARNASLGPIDST